MRSNNMFNMQTAISRRGLMRAGLAGLGLAGAAARVARVATPVHRRARRVPRVLAKPKAASPR